MYRNAEKLRQDAADSTWEASVEALTEITNDEPDFDRIEAAAKEMLGAARKGQEACRRQEAGRDV